MDINSIIQGLRTIGLDLTTRGKDCNIILQAISLLQQQEEHIKKLEEENKTLKESMHLKGV